MVNMITLCGIKLFTKTLQNGQNSALCIVNKNDFGVSPYCQALRSNSNLCFFLKMCLPNNSAAKCIQLCCTINTVFSRSVWMKVTSNDQLLK